MVIVLVMALAAAPDLKLKVDKPQDEAQMQKRATEAVVGYYRALIAGDYEVAATFLRDDAIEPVRKEMLRAIEAGTPAQAQGACEALGVADIAAVQAMPRTKFFAAYAKSQYGSTLRHLATKELEAQVKVDAATCVVAEKSCTVTFQIGGKGKDGKVAWVPQAMQATPVDGRWLLGVAKR